MIYIGLDPRYDPEQLGFVPSFLSEDDPDPARVQLDKNYRHGGGWRPLPGWKLDRETRKITYPGDPPLKPFAMTSLHNRELIYFYPYSQVMIFQMDGSFEVARLD